MPDWSAYSLPPGIVIAILFLRTGLLDFDKAVNLQHRLVTCDVTSLRGKTSKLLTDTSTTDSSIKTLRRIMVRDLSRGFERYSTMWTFRCATASTFSHSIIVGPSTTIGVCYFA